MGGCLSILSNVMYVSEKLAMCLAGVTTVTCLILTLVMMLGLGVGLGYNYCFVDIKTKHRYVPGHYEYTIMPHPRRTRTPPWHRPPTRYRANLDVEGGQYVNNITMQTAQNDSAHENVTNKSSVKAKDTENVTDSLTDMDEEMIDFTISDKSEIGTKISSSSKTVLQIDGLDLLALLAKLKAEKRNYTLQLVTT